MTKLIWIAVILAVLTIVLRLTGPTPPHTGTGDPPRDTPPAQEYTTGPPPDPAVDQGFQACEVLTRMGHPDCHIIAHDP